MKNKLLLIFLLLPFISKAQPNYSIDTLLNKQAPYFSVITIDSTTYKLSELKGKVVVLNFWFILCSPCIREFPLLNKVVETYKDNKNTMFLALCTAGDERSIRHLFKRKPFHYKHVADNRDVAKLYGIVAQPVNLVIDKKGKIVFVHLGYDENMTTHLNEAIDKALKEE